MAFFVFVPAAATYFFAEAVGTYVVGALAVDGLSVAAVSAIGAATISGGVAALKGGDAGDILKSAVLTGATTYIGGTIGKDIASNVRADAIMNGELSFDTANALGNVAGAAGSAMANTALISAANNKPISLDALLKSGLTAGVTSGVSAGVNSITSGIDGFSNLPATAQRAINAGLAAGALGKNVDKSVMTSVLNSMLKDSGATEYINSKLNDASNGIKSAVNDVKYYATSLTENQEAQQNTVNAYNSITGDLANQYNTAMAAKGSYDAAVADYNLLDSGARNYIAQHPEFTLSGRGGMQNTITGEADNYPNWKNKLIDKANAAAHTYVDTVNAYNNSYNSLTPELSRLKEILTWAQSDQISYSNQYTTANQELDSAVINFQKTEENNASYISGLINNASTTGADGKPLSEEQILQNVYQKLADNFASDNPDANPETNPFLAKAQALAENINYFNQYQNLDANKLSEIKTVEDLYRTYLGREPDAQGLADWKAKFGDVIDDQEKRQFAMAAQSEAKLNNFNAVLNSSPEGQTQNIKDYYKQVLGRDVTPDELKTFIDEFGGLDKAIAAAKERTTIAIGADEAASPKDAATLAKLRDPYSTQFTYGGNTYSMAASNDQIQQAYKEAELAKVSTAKTFNEAFAAVRDLKAQGILGANEPFTWNGQSFNTNLAKTPTEASAFDPNTVFKAKSALIEQLADTKTWEGANLSSGELAKFTDAFAKATPEQRASMLKGADAATYQIINNALTTTKQSVDATQLAIKNGTLDITKPVTGSGSISENNATNYLEVVKNIGNNVATDLASTALSGANAVGTLLGLDTSEIKNLQKFMSDDQKKQMDKLVGQEKYAASGLASAVESLGSMAALGVTTAATLPMVAFAVNNAWVEGANSWIDAKGNVYDSKEAATQAAGKDNIRQLTTAENATRSALMGTAEFIGEKFGLPGMAKLMKGIPIGGTAGDILNAVKNAGFGASSEVVSELLTTAMQMGVDKMKNIGLGQNATMQNVADAMKDTLFTTLWAVGGSSTVGSASSALKNVSVDPIPQFQSPVLPEDIWARAKDAGLTAEQLTTLKNEAASLSSVEEINKIESDFKANLSAAGFTPQEIAHLTAPAVSDAVNTNVIDTLKASGVPAGLIADVAKQVTAELTSGNDATTVAHNLINIFDANHIDQTKANTMAANYTGLMTPEQIQKVVTDTLAANPSATAKDVSDAITTATKDFATLTDVKTAISGIQFPAGMNKTDVTNAIADYMKANPGLSITDVAAKITDATKGLATSTGVTTSISDALKGYATTTDIQNAIKGIQFPAGISTADVTSAISAYMKANPGLSLTDVAAKITEATKGLVTDTGMQTAISTALKGVATQQDIKDAIANIKFPAGITPADVTTAITNYMTANPGLNVKDVTAAITDYMKANPPVTAEDVNNSITTATKDLVTTANLQKVQAGLLEKIAANEKAGMDRDTATQQAIADVATELGTTRKDILAQIGATENTLGTRIDDLQTQTQTQIANVQTDLLSKIAANEKAGMTRDQATQKAVADLSTQLGTTKESLLTTIGATEATLGARINDLQTQTQTQITGLSADMQAKYNALTAAQKATVDQLTKQGTDFNTALAQAQTQTQTQITNLSTDLQTKFNALTEQQKALVNQLTQQGIETNTAIAQAQAQTQQQITNVQTDVQTKFNTLTDQQKALATQLTNQGVDLNTAITQVQNQTQAGFTNLSNTLAANQAATQAAIAASNAANQASAVQTQRNSNLNNLMNMLGQAQDTAGQQTTVKAADPAKIGYVYDWKSIFANPAQQNMFVSPYAKGGLVGGSDEVNDELLNILKG